MSWKGICSPRCIKAKTDAKRCKCKCHGSHHGEARPKPEQLEEKETDKKEAVNCSEWHSGFR